MKKFTAMLILGAAMGLSLASCGSNNSQGGGTIPVQAISLNYTSYELEVGKTVQLVATVYPSNATMKEVAWSVTSGGKYASVDSTGLVSGLEAGSATVTATTIDGNKQAICNLTVKNSGGGGEIVHVESVTLNYTSKEIEVGQNFQLTATVLPSNATNKQVNWSVTSGSSNVSVSSTGLVTGLNAGKATITASSVDGNKQASCSVTVTESGGGGDTPVVPSVTTPKDKKSVSPAFQFTFTYNPATSNNESNEYRQLFSDLDPKFADIFQMELVLDMNFGGQDESKQYYGGEFGVGYDSILSIQEQWGDASGFWQYDPADATPSGAYSKGKLHLWFDINTTLTEYDQFYILFTYAAKSSFVAKLETINFYHSEGYSFESKKVDIGAKLITNTSSAGEVKIPLNKVGTNPFSHFDLNLSYTASESYTGGVVWVEGVYAEGLVLPNVPNNSVNIGKKMTPGAGEKTVADIRVYLPNYSAVDPTGYIKLVCNWAPASDITVNSATFYHLSGSAGPSPVIDLDDTFLSETQSPLEEKLTMDNIKIAMGNCIVSQGNNYLLKKAVTLMGSGEQTRIAYIGGSITEGDNMPSASDKITDLPGQAYSASWAYWSYKYISGKYGTGNNVKYLNAGMSGTGSDLGVARFDKDVLSHNPCMVFIEFAVNNGETALDKETYESMIRMALNHSSKPAVILAMSWTSYSGGAVENYMTQLAVKYGLPAISIHKGLNQFKSLIFNNNGGQDCFCSNDNLHPSINGHKLYAKLIGYGIKTIAERAEDSEASLPSVEYSDRYASMKLYQRGDSNITVTGFDTNSQTYVAPTLKSDQISGQGGWKLNGGTGTLSMTASAKAVFVLYCANQYDGSNGTIEVNVTGGHTASSSRQLPKDSKGQLGWGNVCVIVVLTENTAASCNISVSLTGTGQLIGIAVAD